MSLKRLFNQWSDLSKAVRNQTSLSQVDKIFLASCASVILYLTLHKLHAHSTELQNADVNLAFMSNGSMDEKAQKALESLNQKQRADLTAHQLFIRAQLKDLNQHEGQRPSHTRSHEADILQDYAATLTKSGKSRWMYDRIQDYLDRREAQYEDLNLITPIQYRDLQATLNEEMRKQRSWEDDTDIGNHEKTAFERLEKAKSWKANDTQNVHDSGVHNSLRDTLSRLQERGSETSLPIGISDIKTDVMQHIQQANVSMETKEKAMIACHNAFQSNASHPSLSSLNERQVLELVWKRSYHPANNVTQSENIREMVIHNLADTITHVESGQPHRTEQVCVTGRIGRLLDSLTLTDAQSEQIGNPVSIDVMRNDIYDFAQQELQNKIDKFTQMEDSNETNMRNVAISYQDMNVHVSNEDETLFKASIIDEVNDYMSTKYGELLSPHHQSEIMETVKEAL